jgi:hypothetical protein
VTNLSSIALTQAELDVLAHHLAYESATLIVESNCADVSSQCDSPDWFDTGDCDEFAKAYVVNSIAYLEARGLLERHDANPDWITMFDESEAAR